MVCGLGRTKLGKLQKDGPFCLFDYQSRKQPARFLPQVAKPAMFSWNIGRGARVSCHGTPIGGGPMWISLFGITTAAAIGLSVVAILIQGTNKQSLR